MEPSLIAVRALVAYVFLLAILRLSGKRTIALGTPFDFVLALVIGDLVDDLLWAEVPLSQFVVAVVTLAGAHLIAVLSCHASPTAARLLEGSATLIVKDGLLVEAGMRRERTPEREVAEMLRHKGIDRPEWMQVAAARVETSGIVSALRQAWARPARRADRARTRGPVSD
jgi:uncharacterized membrane protein YcaP (DUF421 family)